MKIFAYILANGLKWTNGVSGELCNFALETKKIAQNGTAFKKNAYLCAVVSQEAATLRRAI